MSDTDPRIELYHSLEQSPDDRAALLALADWYDEQGISSAAACLRWAADNSRWPFRYQGKGSLQVSSTAWHSGWYWWALDQPSTRRDWGFPPSCCLPGEPWARLAHTFDYDPAVFKEYPSLRAAWEALFAVWTASGGPS